MKPRSSLGSDLAGTLGVVATSPYQVALFLRSHLAALPPEIDYVIFTNTKDCYRSLVTDLELSHIPVSRAPYLTHDDVRAGMMLRKQLHEAGVRTVVTMSPKAGFIGQLAARSAGIDRRLHIFTGQVWESMPTGPKRLVVRWSDRAIARTASHLAADSTSQAQNLKDHGIVPSCKPVRVPHAPGSIRGVDSALFRPRPQERAWLRARLGLTDNSIAFVQMGRITRAKGVLELVAAFGRLRAAWASGGFVHQPRLFLVGQDEEGLSGVVAGEGVDIMPFTEHPEELLAAMDVCVLASHREGFGSTIIEAGAVGLPAIGTDIAGVRDAVVAGQTGWLVPRMSPDDLYAVMAHILQNVSEVRSRGNAALERARNDFRVDEVARAWAGLIVAVHGGEL